MPNIYAFIGPQKVPPTLFEQICMNPKFPSTVSYQVWLKLAYWFLRRRFLSTSLYITISQFKPLEWGQT